MTYEELCNKILATSHRRDLTDQVQGFVDDARVLLNYRLGLTLPKLGPADDTNEILLSNHLLLFYPAMKALYEYIVEIETAAYYDQLYQGAVADYFINRAGTTPLTITPEVPAP